MIDPSMDVQYIKADGTLTYEGLALMQDLARGRIHRVPFHADGGANVTLTTHPNSAQLLANAGRNITITDLGGYSQYRLTTRITTGSASPNNPRIFGRYSQTFTTVVGQFSDLGVIARTVSLTSTGVVTTDWTDLVPGAIRDNVYLTIIQDGGDGAASPVLSQIALEFR